MNRRTFLATGTAIGALGTAGCLDDANGDEPNGDDANGDEPDGDDGSVPEDDEGASDDGSEGDETVEFTVETVVEGLAHPWAIEFLPDEPFALVTEREGTLLLVDTEEGEAEVVEGAPDVYAEGQGGLLDVALHPAFPEESWVYLTYSVANDDGESTTAIGRGELDVEGRTIEGVEELHAAEPFVDSNGHYGSRVVVDEDALYLTVGDRQDKTFDDHVSQDTTNELGTTLRLALDGSVPSDNPFVDDEDGLDTIYSYGHRNVQGMTVHPGTGTLWQSEHGEEDGDEINVIEGGENYGWPIATYGCEYGTDDPVGDDPEERDGTIPPVHHWECGSGGFPPAGMAFYDGDAFPGWEGDLFVGNLAGQYLGHFTVEGEEREEIEIEEVDPLLADEGWRVRDVAVEPGTGYLHVAVDDGDAPIVRLVPDG
ncbi:PQQ-dependent sugar dehydrogenase [Natronorarus salvus]|uniref:PQQ-dependent sugar dehydrogenase n=1 Tax=Natronorarus salvus TaxID=3117733 RepID=UPI002F263C5D